MLFTLYNKPVKEAYFGSSKNLEEGVKQLEIIVKKIKNTKSVTELIKLDITNSDENKKLQDLLKNEFGFEQMNLFWDSSLVPNAFTPIGGLLIDTTPDKMVSGGERQKNKYYDSDHRYHAAIVVVMNLVKKLSLTARETMAIILHEIGHNFDTCITTSITKLLRFTFTQGLSDIVGLVYKKIVLPSMSTIQKEYPWLKKVFDLAGDLSFELDIFPGNISHLLLYYNPMNIIVAFLGYHGEKFSDKFAATYGFGADLSSALDKMDDPTKMNNTTKSLIYTIPVLRTLYDIGDSSFHHLTALLDPHPTIENRIFTVTKKLEKDLNDPSVPSELKPAIKREIEMNKKIYESNIKMDSRKWAIYTNFVKRLHDHSLKLNGTSDIRDFFNFDDGL